MSLSASVLGVFVLVGVPRSCCECVETPDYYASLQPAPFGTAYVDEAAAFKCSTNVPSSYPSKWEINGSKYPISHIPPEFIANGLNLMFIFQTTVTARCLFSIFLGGSVVDICSNTATIVPQGVNITPGCTQAQLTSYPCGHPTAATNSMPMTPLQSLHVTTAKPLSSTDPLQSFYVTNVNSSTPGYSSHINLAIGVSVVAGAMLCVFVLFATTIAMWIYCHRKNKELTNKKGDHVYEEVTCTSNKDPVVHHNPAYKHPRRLRLEENPSYVSTNKIQ